MQTSIQMQTHKGTNILDSTVCASEINVHEIQAKKEFLTTANSKKRICK